MRVYNRREVKESAPEKAIKARNSTKNMGPCGGGRGSVPDKGHGVQGGRCGERAPRVPGLEGGLEWLGTASQKDDERCRAGGEPRGPGDFPSLRCQYLGHRRHSRKMWKKWQ